MTQPDQFLGSEVLTPDATTPVALTKIPGLGSQPCIAIFQCALLVDSNSKGNVAIRFSDDPNIPPTAESVGMELSPGQSFRTACDLTKFKFIGIAINSRINVRYEAYPSGLNKFF